METLTPRPTPGPYLKFAFMLFGFGLFSVLYPILVLLFAPARVLAPHHLYFLIAGLVLLPAAGVCTWIGRARFKPR